MKGFFKHTFALTLLLTASTVVGLAQDKPVPPPANATPSVKPGMAAMPTGFRGEYVRQLEDVEKKLVDLAQAEPAEKFTWRPAEKVRSVSEVYMHLAGANFFILKFIGVPAPTTITLGRELEKVSDKAKVIDTMTQSFAHVRQAIMNMKDEDMEKTIKLFGRDATQRETFILLLNHMHEHLGQSIAYARMNGITPPWSEGR